MSDLVDDPRQVDLEEAVRVAAEPMGLQGVYTLLRISCKAAGSQKAFAEANGILPQFLSDVVNGRRDPSPALLKALGLRKLPPRYARVRG